PFGQGLSPPLFPSRRLPRLRGSLLPNYLGLCLISRNPSRLLGRPPTFWASSGFEGRFEAMIPVGVQPVNGLVTRTTRRVSPARRLCRSVVIAVSDPRGHPLFRPPPLQFSQSAAFHRHRGCS